MRKKLYKFLRAKDKNKFLNALVEYGTIRRAAKECGLSRQAHYFWMQDDEYRTAYAKAREMANDLIEEEAYRRAVEGQDVKVYYKGEEVGAKKIYSDALLALLLKGAFPDKYKDRVQEEHVGDGSAEISWEGDDDCDEDEDEKENSDTVQAGEAVAGDDTSEP